MKTKLYTCLLCLLAAGALSAQVLDNSFGKKGKVVLPFSNPNHYARASSGLVQPDGKIIISGYEYDEDQFVPQIKVWRLNADGRPDTGFGSGGYVRIFSDPYFNQEYGGYTALQPDGKIIGVGTVHDYNRIYPGHIVLFRLKTDGSFDSSFGTNGKAYPAFGGTGTFAEADAFLLKPDGKIVVTGRLNLNEAESRQVALAQFLPDGKFDSSFGVNGVAVSPTANAGIAGWALTLVTGNKIVAAFSFQTMDRQYHSVLVRYNADGSRDSTFGTKSVTPNEGISSRYNYPKISLAVQDDGKIVEYVAYRYSSGLYRYEADGQPDVGFGTGGLVELPGSTTSSIVIDAQKRILIAGHGPYIARFLPCGSLDSSFGTGGLLRTDFGSLFPYPGSVDVAQALTFQPDGKLLNFGYVQHVVDEFYDYNENFAIARYILPSGSAMARAVPALPALTTKAVPVVYPNPVHDVLTIGGLNAGTSYTLSVTNAEGKQVAVRQSGGAATVSLPVHHLAAGVYAVTLYSPGGKMTLRFEKQ